MNIKKAVLALGSAFMFLTATLNAQEQPWNFGVKSGASISWLRGLGELRPDKQNDQDFSHKCSPNISFSGGLTAGYTFHENIGVGIELLYARLGNELETTKKLPSGASDDDKKNNKSDILRIYSHNIVVPVMLKLFPMGFDSDEGILSIDLGLQGVLPVPVSISVKESEKDSSGVPTGNLKDPKDFKKKDQVNEMTLDLLAGIGYEFPEIGLTIEGRYHFGLMDFFKSTAEAKKYRKDTMKLQEEKNVRNHYATISIGYNFARLLMD